MPGDWTLEGGQRRALALLQSRRPPDAIFAANDLIALGVARAAAEAGRGLGEDLGLVGYDDIDAVRRRIFQAAAVPVGTVPIYQVAQQLDAAADMRPQQFLDVVEQQARQGVDYMTVHCAILREHLPLCERRLTGIVSRGGALVAKWMSVHRQQNQEKAKRVHLALLAVPDQVGRSCRQKGRGQGSHEGGRSGKVPGPSGMQRVEKFPPGRSPELARTGGWDASPALVRRGNVGTRKVAEGRRKLGITLG